MAMIVGSGFPAVTGVVAAAPGLKAVVYAPAGTDIQDVPAASLVVAWAAVADLNAVGGLRLDPVFLAGGRAWTPDQFRAAFGEQLDVRVAPPG